MTYPQISALTKLINTGILESYEEPKKRIILTVNTLSLITALVASIGPSMIYLFITPQTRIVLPGLIEAAAFISVVILNKYHLHTTATFLFMIFQNAAIIYFGLALDKSVGVQQMAIFLIGLSFLLFNDLKLRILSVLLSAGTILLLETNYRTGLFQPLQGETPAAVRLVVFPIIIILNTMVVILYNFNKTALYRKLKLSSDALEKRSKELEEVNKQLEKATIAKSLYVRETNHELRSPFNAIYQISQVLLKEVEKNPAYAPLESMVKDLNAGCDNALGVIGNVLELSRIEAGKAHELKAANVQLRPWLNKIIKIQEYNARVKGVQIQKEIDPTLPAFLLMDKVKMSMIVTNLVYNAIKFTHKQSCIYIRAYRDHDHWLLEVQDEGDGISPEKLSTIFDVFVTGGHNNSGTGLGLQICKHLVENVMGGSLSVESTPGAGCTFYVRLPMEVPDSDWNGFSALPEADAADYSGKKVVVVEDDPMSQLLVKNYLLGLGFEVHTADTGLEGLDKVRCLRPDFVILDIQLPDVTGSEVLRMIRRSEPLRNIPVIVASGNASSDDLAMAMHAGANEYVLKPIQYHLLQTALANCLAPVGDY